MLVEIENKNFIISNIHLKTKISNQKLVETIIPIKFISVEEDNNYKYITIFASHRWALSENLTNQKLYNYGDRVVGKVVKIANDYALIDIGVEKFAYIGLKNISLQAESCEEVVHFGLTREFVISTPYYNEYKTLVSQVPVTFQDLNKIFQFDDEIKAIVVTMDIKKRRVAVSTRELEIEPGDMLKNPKLVYKKAEEMAIRYRKLVIEKINNLD